MNINENIKSFQKLINDPITLKTIKNKELEMLLSELATSKTSLSIKPLGRYRCMLCSEDFSQNTEKYHIDSCHCLQVVHKSCLKEELARKTFFAEFSCKNCNKAINDEIIGSMQRNNQEEMNKNNVVSDIKQNTFEICTKCTDKFQSNELIKLECSHQFCEKCIKKHFSTVDSLKNPKCPAFTCDKPIDKNIIEKIRKNKYFNDIYESITKKVKEEDINDFPNIPLNPNEKLGKCPECSNINILDHKSPYLDGNTLWKCTNCFAQVHVQVQENGKKDWNCNIF